jgi:hypothetical protein
MPDSLPPNGGPSPKDGWDLEGLLSGENVWVPEGMRPVAVTLAVLRSAPVRAELAGEATARGMFRQIMAARESTPGRSGGETGDARTLVLQTPAADGGPHLVSPPRHSHRRPPRRGRWQSKALVGAAAAAVVIAGTALAGTFSGGGPPGLPGGGPGVTSATSQPAGTSPVANGLEGSATKEAAPGVSDNQHSSSGPDTGPGPGALCRQYWVFFSHPESSASVKAENDNLQQLSELAGGLWNVNRYCTAYAPLSAGPPVPGSNPGGPDFQDPGSTQGSQGKNSSSGQHGGNGTGNGNDGTGNGSNGTGNGSNGTGKGGDGTGKGSNGSGQGGKSSGAGGLQ